MTSYPNKLVKVGDLVVGDVIKQFEGPWGTAIVESVGDTWVTFARPYGTTAGFTCGSAGVPERTIVLTGHEQSAFLRTGKEKFYVYRRPEAFP